MQQQGSQVGGKYQLVRRLARGGMGAVWQARHLELESDVAIKFVRADVEGDRLTERFRREARVLAQLKSAHVVHIYDFGVDDQVPYIAMELLRGEDLGQYLDRVGRLAPREAVELIRQAARGLRAAHDQSVVHRDIKPSNLFLDHHGDVPVLKLLDFGIAKEHARAPSETTSTGQTTAAGVVLGSPAYMSPEQARGASVGPECDVWSLSAVLYRMLTGKQPLDGTNTNDLVVNICTTQAPAPTSVRADLDPLWDEFFQRALRLQPLGRLAHLDEWEEALAQLCQSSAELVDAYPLSEARRSRPFGSGPFLPGATVPRDDETRELVERSGLTGPSVGGIDVEDSVAKTAQARSRPSEGETASLAVSTSAGSWQPGTSGRRGRLRSAALLAAGLLLGLVVVQLYQFVRDERAMQATSTPSAQAPRSAGTSAGPVPTLNSSARGDSPSLKARESAQLQVGTGSAAPDRTSTKPSAGSETSAAAPPRSPIPEAPQASPSKVPPAAVTNEDATGSSVGASKPARAKSVDPPTSPTTDPVFGLPLSSSQP